MGTRRRASKGRLLLRITKAVSLRDTLLPCPACKQTGKRFVEYLDGNYRLIDCRWCDSGMTDRESYAMFARWERIVRHNPKG